MDGGDCGVTDSESAEGILLFLLSASEKGVDEPDYDELDDDEPSGGNNQVYLVVDVELENVR